MPKRISRKLLVGLGSIVTFGAVGTVSGFGIKSIIDSSLNNSKLNQLTVNSSETGTITDLPNYNVATEDMFIKTKNLKRFHFGNTQIGQKITPLGWLGVFEDDAGIKSRIALTGWNGEIIWVNENYTTLDKYNVYDMQYDFKSNLIFVLRTNSTNGFYDYDNNIEPDIYLEVLNAKTGEKYKDSVSDNDFEIIKTKAKAKLENLLLLNISSNDNLKKKAKNLYYLDVVYSPEKKAAMATWMPNFMQMARQTGEGKLPSFYDVIESWPEVAQSFIFDQQKLTNGQTYDDKERNFKLTKSTGFREDKDQQGKTIEVYVKENSSTEIRGSEIYLLTNPFFTTSANGNAFIMHLIGATDAGKVYHKTIGWTIDLSDSANNNEGTVDSGLDNIEFWTNGGNYFRLKSGGSWSKAKGWAPEFINANLRVNKNMFDENSIVFAYPYSSSADVPDTSTGTPLGNMNRAMPLFNVTQILLNPSNRQFTKGIANFEKDNFNYDFGKQIDDYYETYGGSNGSGYADTNLNNIYPYPTSGSFDEKNVNHSYNRLISVSPFDNTIIYAAKPNIREGIFGPHNGSLKDSWAGFWIANSWAYAWNKGQKYYHPLVIANDSSLVSTSDRFNAAEMEYMVENINDFYSEGFTFDIRSMIDADWRTSLNLYFNQTSKTGVNDTYNTNDGFQSSKIGLLRDVLFEAGSNEGQGDGAKGWGTSVAPKYPGVWNNFAKKLFVTTVNKDSFSSIIHSRADLKKWYPRTWANANFPSNMLKSREIFHIDQYDIKDVAVASQFNIQLKGSAFNESSKSIDLVTAWKDKNENNSKYNRRFDRLIMQRPIFSAGESSEEDDLGMVTTYKLIPFVYNQVVNKRGWEIRKNRDNLEIRKVDTIPNTSKQILSAWGNAYKMKKIGSTTASLDQTNTVWNEEITVTPKLDKKDHPNDPNKISFGNNNNNNIERNGVHALRLMLRIVKPSGTNLPAWITGLQEEFFNRAYPLEPAYTGETIFKDVIKAFADEKAKLIDLSDSKNNNNAVGLGNLKIEAYLELNPKFASYNANTDKIYTVPGGKAIVDKSNANKNQLIIYKDDSRLARTIYDQSQINYNQFNQGGFGTSTTTSWSATNELNNLKNIKVTINYENLQDTLVRKQGSTDPLLTFDFKQGSANQLELQPTDRTWFENHFKNYNRLLGVY